MNPTSKTAAIVSCRLLTIVQGAFMRPFIAYDKQANTRITALCIKKKTTKQLLATKADKVAKSLQSKAIVDPKLVKVMIQ